MGMAVLQLLFLVGSASAFVCMEPVEQIAKKTVGEKCGGACSSFGDCEEGLTCVVEKATTASPFSFAILAPARNGICVAEKEAIESEEPTEERRSLQRMGGSREADRNNPDVIAAAKFAEQRMVASSNALTPATLVRIVSAEQQVVAGIKYTLTLEMSDHTQHRVQIVDQPWMDTRYNFLADDLVR